VCRGLGVVVFARRGAGSEGDAMNDDEAMALVLRYARQFYKSDAVYVPQPILQFAAYCLQQMSVTISAALASRFRETD
jgi:hypothetical protein